MTEAAKMAAWQHDWYVRNRQNNPAWHAVNAQRGRDWRAANSEHKKKSDRLYRLRKRVEKKFA